MATVYLHNDNFTGTAIQYLDEAIALSPRSADLYNLRGIAHSKAGDGARADADFRKVTELSPRAAEAHMSRPAPIRPKCNTPAICSRSVRWIFICSLLRAPSAQALAG